MLVTLDLFSGRPNPTWRISRAQLDELRTRQAASPAPPVRTMSEVVLDPPPLGYRGLVVTEDVPGELVPSPVAQQFAIASPWSAAPGADARFATRAKPGPTAEEDLDAADWLLTTAPPTLPQDLLDGVRSRLDDLRRSPASRGGSAERRSSHRAGDVPAVDTALTAQQQDAACSPFLAPQNLSFWNSPAVQPWNNCYNYASNFVSGTRAQPGRRSGQIYASFAAGDVVAAAARDGLQETCQGEVRVVALAVWPGYDFHWYRLHPGGFWAHKVGWWPAQNRDNSFRVLGDGLTPSTCDRGPYSEFVGYFFMPLSMWVA